MNQLFGLTKRQTPDGRRTVYTLGKSDGDDRVEIIVDLGHSVKLRHARPKLQEDIAALINDVWVDCEMPPTRSMVRVERCEVIHEWDWRNKLEFDALKRYALGLLQMMRHKPYSGEMALHPLAPLK